MRRTTTIVLFAALLAFGGAACSKKSENAASDTSSTTTTAASGSGSGSGGASTTTKAPSSGGGGGTCPTQAEVDAVNSKMDSITSGATSDAATLKSSFDEAMSEMEKFIPDNLKDDLQTVREATDKYLSALEGMDLSSPANLSPEQMQKLQQASAELEKPEVQQAQKNLQDYFKTNCPGINFGGDSTSTTTG